MKATLESKATRIGHSTTCTHSACVSVRMCLTYLLNLRVFFGARGRVFRTPRATKAKPAQPIRVLSVASKWLRDAHAARTEGPPERVCTCEGRLAHSRSAETSDDSLSLALVAAGRASENPQHAPSRAGGTYARPSTHLPRIFLVRKLSCAAGPQAGGAVL